MMDFFVRECRAVVDGPMIMIRLGSCGSLSDCKVGDMCVPSSSFLVQRNVDYFSEDGDNGSPYLLSKTVNADPEITQILVKNMSAALGEDHVWSGINATADSFYSSQGRQDENFVDENQELFTQLLAHEPKTLTLEMETFVLYHLAKSSTQASFKKNLTNGQSSNGSKNSIRAGACMMVFAQRKTNDFITKEDVARVEPLAGKGIFESMIQVSLGSDEELHSEEGSVWAIPREI